MSGLKSKEDAYKAVLDDLEYQKELHSDVKTKSVRQICREHGIDTSTFYRWKKKKSWKTAFPEIKEKKEKGIFGKIKSFFGFSKMKCSGCGQEW